MNNVSAIIDGLGGNASVSRALGIKPSAVSEMKRRGSIPPRYWMGLIQLAHNKGVSGITADTILAAHAENQAAAEVAA